MTITTRRALLLTGSLIQTQAWAQEKSVDTIGSARHLSSVLLGLLAIIALIFLLAWFYRKASGGHWLRNSAIRVVAAMALGTRERLLLVEVGGTQMLLGVTSQNINTLHVFGEPVVDATEPQPAGAFQEKLRAAMAGREKSSAGIDERQPGGQTTDQP